MKAMSWMPLIARSASEPVKEVLILRGISCVGRVADEVADVGDGVAGRVEDLVGGDARPGIAGDVADRVAAALARGEPGIGDLPQQQLGVAQRHVVDLDVLPGGDVAFVQRRVLLDDAGEGVHLLRRHSADRKLDPDHLHVGLALTVDALFEAEADELVLLELTGEELLGFVVEVVELALDHRDDVTRDVLVGLRVIERCRRGLCRAGACPDRLRPPQQGK